MTPPRTAKQLNALMRQYPSVQLATLVEGPPEGEGWLHEIKFDGYRLLGFVRAGAACLRTRNARTGRRNFLPSPPPWRNYRPRMP